MNLVGIYFAETIIIISSDQTYSQSGIITNDCINVIGEDRVVFQVGIHFEAFLNIKYTTNV